MSPRSIRLFLGLLILFLSAALLLWGFWPAAHQSSTVPIYPEDMQLPDESFLPELGNPAALVSLSEWGDPLGTALSSCVSWEV